MAASVKVPPSSLPGYDEAGPWFYNALSGAEIHEAGIEGFLEQLRTHLAGDWYGFKTQADVNNAVKTEGWPPPTGSIGQAGGQAAGKAAGNVVGSLFQVQGSGFAGWFLRGLKIALGGILIIVGLGRITGADSAIGKLAGKVPVPL